MQDVCNILLYCNTDVVIIKPVTGRARICSASLKITRRSIALGFSQSKKVCQHSHSSDPVPVHTMHTILLYAIYRDSSTNNNADYAIAERLTLANLEESILAKKFQAYECCEGTFYL